jgi:hypothetical protein
MEAEKRKKAAADVVGESLGRSADVRGKNLRRDRPETGEISGAEKSKKGTQKKEHELVSGSAVKDDKSSRCEEIRDVCFLPPDPVADEPEADVPKPHARLHDDDPGGRLDHIETHPSLLRGKPEVGGDPGEKTPPSKHRPGVHQAGEEYAGCAEGELDRYVKLTSRSGEKRRHWIYGDWRKGFPHSVAPTGRDWALEVEELALQIRTPVVLLIAEE